MRILAIRGKNLTSLAGEFCIDFQSEPLASAGLFAISGPTGAGKSTLLDAICLALYEETPRLSRKSGRSMEIPDVGKETLTQYDVRTLLRRGAADGYAEVDFSGADGVVYRARWSVRRAGGKVGGRLQKTEHSLLRLADQQRLGSTNSEVKKEIEQRVGLGFEQFTRAVILAQNEFAAFLKADDNQRGELLEALTGSDIYSDISMRAFARAKEEQAALQQLRTRLADQQPLGPDERLALENEVAQATLRLAELDGARETLEIHLRWYQELEQLALRHAEAAQAHQAAVNEQSASQPMRALLSDIETAQPARALLTDHDRLCREAAEAEEALTGAHEQLETARSEQQQAADELILRQQQAEQAEAAYRLAQPDLDRAKALDAEIDMLLPARAQAQSRWETAQSGSGAADTDRRQKQANLDETRRAKMDAEAWLRDHAGARTLAEGWQRYALLLTEAGQAHARHAGALAALPAARQSEQEQAQTHAGCANALALAEQQLTEAAARRKDMAAALARFDADDLLAAQRRAMREKEALMELDGLRRELTSGKSRHAALQAEIEQLARDIAQADEAARETAEALLMQQASLLQAEHALRIAAAACGESIERLRESLEPGIPCPVCGATSHPYLSQDERLHAVLRELEADVVNQRAQLEELVRRQARHAAVAGAGQTRLTALGETLSQLSEQVSLAEGAFTRHPLVVADASLLTADIAAKLLRVEHELETINAREQQWRLSADAAAAALAEYDAAAERRAACADALANIAAGFAEASAGRRALEEKIGAAEHECDALLREIDPAFPETTWRAHWRDDPQAFLETAARTVEHWLDQCRRHEALGSSEAIQAVAVAAATDAAAVAERTEKEARLALEQIAAQLTQRQASRRTLFDGAPVQTVENALHDTWQTARRLAEEHAVVVQQRQNALLRATDMLAAAANALQACRDRQAAALNRLEQWLENAAATGLSIAGMPGLRELLAYAPQWISEKQQKLQALDQAAQQAGAVLRERGDRLRDHEQQRPAGDLGTVQARHQALTNERRQMQDACTTLQVRLRNDDQLHQQASALTRELAEREEAARAWAQLNELIGSADGKKFRNYAQQFTLDRLLAYANHHLAGISRRYRLERTDMLALVAIDQEMGDEVRSVHSLSGGESFLISLALALALASLSSNRIQVDSLFIDEGFGSLDSDTLLTAMDALDSLQAQGRKVGVISHVQEMTERIDTQIQIRKGPGGQSHLAILSASRSA